MTAETQNPRIEPQPVVGDSATVPLKKLAINGGPPAFDEPLFVGRPNIGDRDRLMERLNDILDRRWLTNNGQYVQEFEKRIEELLNVEHCIAMCNATVALEIAARAVGLHGEVIIPSFTFVATAHALQWQQITPVFCDVDPVTHTLDPAQVERLITPRTTGIIGVHLWGRSCDVEALQQIARRNNLKLLFDAAHAFGCSHRGRMIGSFGDAEIFSFHATKFINTCEGGAVVTNDDELASKIRLMKNFGFAGYDNVIHLGTNGKMNEMSAAMGITSLESMDDFININRRNFEAYRCGLGDLTGISLIEYDASERNNYQYIVVEVDESRAGVSRDRLVEILHAENVIARRYFYPGCHNMEPYRSCYPSAGVDLPNTNHLGQRLLCLPNGPSVSVTQVDTVCGLIQLAVESAEKSCRTPANSVADACDK